MAHLWKKLRRMALCRPIADQSRQRRQISAEVDVPDGSLRQVRNHAPGIRSPDVRHRPLESRICAGRPDGPLDLALSEAAAEWSEHLLRAGQPRLRYAGRQIIQ